MLGVVTEFGTEFERVLASRNVGDREDMLGYIKQLVNAKVPVVLVVDPKTDLANPKRPIDHRTDAMKQADIRSGTCPVGTDGKAASGWYAVITSPKRAEAMWAEATKDGSCPNVGINFTRMNIVIVDVDNAGDLEAFQHWWSTSFPGAAVPEMTVRSPGKRLPNGAWEHRNGGHIYLKLPEGADITALRNLSEDLSEDARKAQGRKGWVIMASPGTGVLIPVSVRPEGAYVYTGAPIATAPPALLPMLQAPVRTPSDGTDTRDPRLAAWEDSKPWADLLLPHGWVPANRTESCGCPLWTRPGKGVPGAKSAVAHEVACGALSASHKRGALHIYSDAAPAELRGEKTWSKLAFVAAMNKWNVPTARKMLGIDRPLAGVKIPPRIGSASGEFASSDGSAKEAPGPSFEAAPTVAPPDEADAPDNDPATEANDDEDGEEGPPSRDDSAIFCVTATRPDGSEFTVDLSRQTITSEGIIDEPYPDNTSPFGIQPVSLPMLKDLEEEFFSSHPVLKRIHYEAYRYQNDPWTLTAQILNNMLSYVPSCHVLTTKSGIAPTNTAGGGSLNNALAVIASTTAGKSDSVNQANALLPPLDRRDLGNSTGQSLLKEFIEVKELKVDGRKVYEQLRVRDSVTLLYHEAAQLFAEGDRSGSPIYPILRMLVFGQSVSNGTSDRSRYALLRAGTYRFTMTLLGQPGTVGKLFSPAEIQGGTPGRFLTINCSAGCQFTPPPEWADEPLPRVPLFKTGSPSSNPSSQSDDAAGVVNTITDLDPVVIPRSTGADLYMQTMHATRRALVQRTLAPDLTEDQQQLLNETLIQFHIPLMWGKLEAGFAGMFGSVDDDGIIRPDLEPLAAKAADTFIRVHRATLSYTWNALHGAARAEEMQAGELLGVRQAAADQSKSGVVEGHIHRKRVAVVKFIRSQPGKQATRREIARRCFNSRRGASHISLMVPVLEGLVNDEVLDFDGGSVYSLRSSSARPDSGTEAAPTAQSATVLNIRHGRDFAPPAAAS